MNLKQTGRRAEGGNKAQRACFVLPALMLAVALGAGCSTSNMGGVASPAGAAVADGRVIESLGIRIAGLRLSSAGYMLDFRYQVMDQDKAAALMDTKIKPYLVVGASGIRLDIPDTPKLGLLRQTPRKSSVAKQRDYFIMFANLGRRVQPGDKVSMVVGDTIIENLSVQ